MPEPDFSVQVVHGDDVIVKRLRLGVAPRGVEHLKRPRVRCNGFDERNNFRWYLSEHFLEQLQVGKFIKGFVKAQERPGALKAVSSQPQFIHGVNCSNIDGNTLREASGLSDG